MRRFLWLMPLIAWGCALGVSPDGPVEVRVANASEIAFEGVLVDFAGEAVSYGSIGAGTASEYRRVERAYRYAYVELTAGGREHVLQPIDYVGEKTLPPGRYTYEIRLFEGSPYLSLTLRTDN